jgi:hypothetical protein
LDLGLIGTFALFHQPIAVTTAAVLFYHAISLWVPALLGSVAFVQLRRTLNREAQPAAICAPLAEPIEAVGLPVGEAASTTSGLANNSDRATSSNLAARELPQLKQRRERNL